MSNDGGNNTPWYSELTRYHWFVFVVAALGWLFDCLDQQLFILARPAAMKELLAPSFEDPTALKNAVTEYGNYATSIFLAGWAMGGLFFGVMGDRYGRAKTMLITILLYSIFTGTSSFSVGFWDFAIYRFLTGLGVGGEFAVGVALVAEVMPNRARPYMLGLLQALSALGNITAALINLGLGIAEEEGLPWSPWRIMFLVGALPALLTLVIRARLKEPEKWQHASHSGAVAKQLGSYSLLFHDPRWRKHALLGLLLACSGVIGLWGVGFFTPDLIRLVQKAPVTAAVYEEQIAAARAAGNTTLAEQFSALASLEKDPQAQVPFSSEELAKIKGEANIDGAVNGRLSRRASYVSILINLGAFCGMFTFGVVSQKLGRKPTFVIALLSAFAITVSVFYFLTEIDLLQGAMIFLMGVCQLSLFAGYAIYFPELFPTHLRSTGTSFCYNVGRFVAATGPLIQAQLIAFFAKLYPGEPLRYAGITMCAVFLVGLVALPFLPETKGKPLPE